MTTITVTKEYLQGLRKEYDKAVADKKEQFNYKGSDFVTGYAKYFLQYWEPQFGIKTKQ